jgi:CheY-like chemotaxis protein
MADILVVDNDRDTCDAPEVILHREGCTVLIAALGKETLDRLQHPQADVLLATLRCRTWTTWQSSSGQSGRVQRSSGYDVGTP